MKKMVISLILALIFWSAVVVLPEAIRHNHSKRGRIIKIPTVNEMTSEEYSISSNLFDGDTLVRVALDQEHDTVNAVYTSYCHAHHSGNIEENEIVHINSFLNNGQYLVE